MKQAEVDARLQEVITDEQAQFFLEQGYLIIRNVLAKEELETVQDEMMKLVEKGAAGVPDDPDYMYGKGKKTGQQILRRVEYVMEKSDSMKALMGHPFILRSVEKLQGRNFIPTWDSMVLKMPDEGIIVPWHRDAEVPEGCTDPRPIFNVDFYLDQADLKSCIWVIPGSHLWDVEQSRARCRREEFDTSDAVPVPMNPGDVIFHNIKVLHGSPSGDGNGLRRTVYFEFRPAEIEAEFGPHTAEYIPLKQQVLLAGIRRRSETGYGREETSFTYSPDGAYAAARVEEPETFRYPHEKFWRNKKE